MPKNPAPPEVRAGRFVDSGSGLLIPRGYTGPRVELNTVLAALGNGLTGRGFSQGTMLERDPATLAVRWPAKGSGYDDFVSQSIVDGTVANVGLSPVVAPQISAVVRRQQNQAATASIDLTGRSTPVKVARDAIARFNDSPMGATQALERIVYGICTYNRGAPIATVPIIHSFETWEANGLNIRPLPLSGETESTTSHFYLEVDWAKHGTPVPYLPSIYDLEPSGIQAWPYWYRVKVDNRPVWVLLHHTHIIEFTPGVTGMPGIGTSPVWMCLGRLAEDILVIEERVEKALYTMTDGIIMLAGVEGTSGEQIEKRIKEARAEAETRGFVAAKPPVILTSPLAEKVGIARVNFREPNGVDFKAWREYNEDVIAQCFDIALSEIVTRGGVGYGAQAETVADNAAESGVGSILYKIGNALGAIYPRVSISVSRSNDRAQRLNIKTLTDFATGAAALVDRGILSASEVRSIINRDVLSIPEVGIDAVVATANTEDSDDAIDTNSGATTMNRSETPKRVNAARQRSKSMRRFDTLFDDGDVIITDEDVELALQRARDRVDDDLYALLTATPVSE